MRIDMAHFVRLKRGSKHEFTSGARPLIPSRAVSERGRKGAGNNAEHLCEHCCPRLSGGRANAPALAWFAPEKVKVPEVCGLRGTFSFDGCAEPRPPNESFGVRAYMSAHFCYIIACYAREI